MFPSIDFYHNNANIANGAAGSINSASRRGDSGAKSIATWQTIKGIGGTRRQGQWRQLIDDGAHLHAARGGQGAIGSESGAAREAR